MTGIVHPGKDIINILKPHDCPEARFGFWPVMGCVTLDSIICNSVYFTAVNNPLVDWGGDSADKELAGQA